MLRVINFLMVLLLLGSAGWAYSEKYKTVYIVEQVKKLEIRMEREREAITVLKAEWQLLNRPARLQALAQKHLDFLPLSVAQVVRLNELPPKRIASDAIGNKMLELGLTASIPSASKAGAKASSAKPLSSKANLSKANVSKPKSSTQISHKLSAPKLVSKPKNKINTPQNDEDDE